MKILSITPVSHIQGIVVKLNGLGEVTYLPNASKAEVINQQLLKEYDAIYVNPNKLTYMLDRETIGSSVKVICTASTGTNHIDKEYCKINNIEIISLTTDYETIRRITSTAEHAFALTMSLIRNIPKSFDSVKNGEWDYTRFIGRQIDKLAIGVVGYGRLGSIYANFCNSFGADVLVCDPYVKDCPFPNMELDSLFYVSDVVSLHVHINKKTEGMINKGILEFAKNKKPYLINTSRGGIVDEDDIIFAIESNWIEGYATDVLVDELGNIKESKLIDAAKSGLNIIITPHIGGMTKEAQEIAYNRVADKLKIWNEIN